MENSSPVLYYLNFCMWINEEQNVPTYLYEWQCKKLFSWWKIHSYASFCNDPFKIKIRAAAWQCSRTFDGSLGINTKCSPGPTQLSDTYVRKCSATEIWRERRTKGFLDGLLWFKRICIICFTYLSTYFKFLKHYFSLFSHFLLVKCEFFYIHIYNLIVF